MTKPLNVADFLAAQAAAYPQALLEIQAGKKRSHWIWFVLPQLEGLGSSIMAKRYGIADIQAAQTYLSEPLLRARLYEMIAAIAAHQKLSAQEILGEVDALKLRSCLTLFIVAQSGNHAAIAPLAALLNQKFHANPCEKTLARLGCSPLAFSTLVNPS